MSESACPVPGAPPRCPRCQAPLVRAELPSGVLGIAGEPCADCNDAATSRPVPWRCPRCGGMWLFDAAGM